MAHWIYSMLLLVGQVAQPALVNGAIFFGKYSSPFGGRTH